MSEINVSVTSAPITASVTGGDIAATVAAGGVSADIVGGFGPQGPVGPPGTTSWNGLTDKPATFPPSTHVHVAADITDFVSAVIAAAPPTTNASLLTSGTLADARLSANVVFTGDSRLTDARTPLAHTHTAAEIIDFTTAVLAAAPKPSLTLSGGTTTPLVLELSQAVA